MKKISSLHTVFLLAIFLSAVQDLHSAGCSVRQVFFFCLFFTHFQSITASQQAWQRYYILFRYSCNHAFFLNRAWCKQDFFFRLRFQKCVVAVNPRFDINSFYVVFKSRLQLFPEQSQRDLVHPELVRAAQEVWGRSGIHRPAHPCQQESVHDECGQHWAPCIEWKETDTLLYFNAHERTVFPSKNVAESAAKCAGFI